MDETYHVVCHDCRFEHVEHDEAHAHYRMGKHQDETDHDVEYARIDGGAA